MKPLLSHYECLVPLAAHTGISDGEIAYMVDGETTYMKLTTLVAGTTCTGTLG